MLCLTAMQKDPSRRYRSVDSCCAISITTSPASCSRRAPTALATGSGSSHGSTGALATAAGAFAVLVSLVAGYTMRLTQAGSNLALAQSARAERIQRFMVELFEGSDESAGPSDTPGWSAFERGAQEARLLDGDP